jgi:hypothetical protein
MRVKASREDHGKHFFMATSAIPLRQGEGYYKNTMVTLNSAAYGLTRHLAASAGLDLFSLVSSRANQPRWYSRLQLSGSLGDLVHVGAQAMYVALPIPTSPEAPVVADPTNGFISGLGMITVGNTSNQITIMGGMANGVASGDRPKALIGAAGMARLAPNIALVTEHWWFPDPSVDYPVHSIGVRVLGSFLAVDIGLVNDRELAGKVFSFGMPFVAGTLNF